MKVLLLLAMVLALGIIMSGCADTPKEYAQCTLPITRNIGLGVKIPGCANWEFGPSKAQSAAFSGNWRKE
jgi:hypothetical protein